jgi:hypothetical protein
MNSTDLKRGDIIVISHYNKENIAIFDCIKEPGFNPETTLHIFIEMDINNNCCDGLILKDKDYDFSYDLNTITYRTATDEEKTKIYNTIGKYFTEEYDKDWYKHFTDSSYFDIQDYLFEIFCIEVHEYDNDLIYPDFINDIHTYIWDKLCEAMGVPNTVENEPEKVNKQEFIEKVIEWVKNRDNVEKYLHVRTSLTDNFADALRKYLEERL